MTWRGFGYLLLTAVVYLVLAYSGFSPLAVLMPLLIVLPFLSAIQLLITARSLKLVQNLEPALTERGKPARLQISLFQHGWFSQGEIDLVTVLPGPGIRRSHERRVMSLLGGTSRAFSIDLPCPHRGHYQAGISSVRARDILSLFYLPIRSRRRCRRTLPEVIVLPSSAPSADFSDLTSFLYDWQHKQTPEAGNEVDAVTNIRAHRPGDSLKRTHWKLTARLDEVMIKEFENPIRQAGLILIDMARPLASRQRQAACLEIADSLTDRVAYLTRLLLADGNSLRLVNYQRDGRHELLAGQPADLQQTQLMLTDLDWSDGWPVENALAEETQPEKSACFIVLVSTRLNIATVSLLYDLQQRGRPVWLVLLAHVNREDPGQQEALQMITACDLPMTLLDDDKIQGEKSS